MPRMGAEFMALETTAEAGTCLACRSMLGLVGSSARVEGMAGEGGRKLNLLAPHPQPCLQAQTTSLRPLKSPRALLRTCPRLTVPHQQDSGRKGSAPAFHIILRAPGVELGHPPQTRLLRAETVSPSPAWELLEDKDHLQHRLGVP